MDTMGIVDVAASAKNCRETDRDNDGSRD